ncbi:bacterial membrane protein YfhO [Clostridium sp. BL-8]|nr:bacterial membrane protein YfhO [Clostridium sp. BL-8]
MKLLKMICNKNIIKKTEINSLKENLRYERLISFAYPLALVFLVLTSLVFIEYKHPYFFLQDDNRDSYLPYFVHNYESILNGELPLYNFHQFLGIPSLAIGQTAALYPITYFSVFLSKYVFGHYFAAIDIQVIIHLMIGAVGFYKLIKFFGNDHKAAFFGGLTWPLSSFVIYVSNSWVVVAAVAAYFPWMLLFSFSLYKRPTLKTMIYAVLVRLLLFYAGHVQYFIYSVIFEFITVICNVTYSTPSGKKRTSVFNFLKKYVESYIYVFIFSLPLLLPMWHLMTISYQRSEKLPFEVFVDEYFPINQLVKGLFYPFLQIDENTEFSYRNMINLSHIGYIPIVILVIGIIEKYIIKSKKSTKNSVNPAFFIIPMLIALLWSTNWIFNAVIYSIPILNRFRWPFKLALFLDFYLIVIASICLSNFIKQLSLREAAKKALFCLIIGIQIFNFIFLYIGTPYKDFGEHHADKLPLEEKLKDKLTGGRIISLGFDIWSPTPKNNANYLTAPTMGFSYATLWGLDYLAGYEVLITQANLDAALGLNFTGIVNENDSIKIDYFRKAAVKWYIVPKSKADKYSEKLNAYGIVKKYEDEYRVVFYDEKAYPMVFNSSGEQVESDNYKVTTNNIELNVNLQQSDKIIFNNIYNPFFEGYVDGKKVELKPINNINFFITVPEGKHKILIKYKDPYLIIGTYIAITFFIIFMVRYTFKRKLNYSMK